MSESKNNCTRLSDSEIEKISNKLNNLMINIKSDMKLEINPNINDMPSFRFATRETINEIINKSKYEIINEHSKAKRLFR